MNNNVNKQINAYTDTGGGRRKNAILWQILFYLTLLLLCFSFAGTIVTAMLGLYSHTASDTIVYQRLRITQKKAIQILNEYELYINGWDFYDLSGDYRGITNFRYRIYRVTQEGESVYVAGNYVSDPYEAAAEYSDTYYLNESHFLYSATESTKDEQSSLTTHILEERRIEGYYCPQSGVIDLYTVMEYTVSICDAMRYLFPLTLVGLAILCVILGVVLTRQLWQLSTSAEGTAMLLSRIPFDFICVFAFIVISFIDFIVNEVNHSFRENLPDLWAVGILTLLLLALPFFFTLIYSALVVQLEKRHLLASTIIARLLCKAVLPTLRLIRSGLVRFFKMIPFAWRTAIAVPVVGLVLLLLTIDAYTEGGVATFLLTIVGLAIYALSLYAAYAIRVLQKSGEELSRGNLTYKTNTRHLHSVFRELAENLNAIGEGMEVAIEEKIKSEHFKTELITNVSHDIKTPLTSIINYADLLSKETLSGKAHEYTEILLRQSARLKKLTEDLVEASKATTGNLPCNPERLSLCQIVRQSLGEYEERLESVGLQVRETIPENDLYAMVDGRLLWRVLENLYSNATKYALPGTRVYLVVTEDDGHVCISMKNISKEPLSIDGEDLTERFVKGDTSRSSEGSGLGLNIAKSLVELQHGTFRVTCDGDLFRCDIVFPTVE